MTRIDRDGRELELLDRVQLRKIARNLRRD
jgi:hypothetical protein